MGGGHTFKGIRNDVWGKEETFDWYAFEGDKEGDHKYLILEEADRDTPTEPLHSYLKQVKTIKTTKKMNTQIKTAFYWLLLGICFLTHSVLHMYGLFYGVDLRLPDATGEVPLGAHVFNTVIFTVTFLMALLSIQLPGRGFRWFAFVWSALFLPLNIFHLYATAFVETFDLSQVCLLTFALAVNVLLTLALWKSLKKRDNKQKQKQ
jgi:hypothetical protein